MPAGFYFCDVTVDIKTQVINLYIDVTANITTKEGTMEQKEKRESLIRYLLNENERLKKYEIPENEDDQKKLLRALINVRMPIKADEAFLEIMDSYLQEENFMNMVNIDDPAVMKYREGLTGMAHINWLKARRGYSVIYA